MNFNKNKLSIKNILIAVRAYSLTISVTSWGVAFLYSLLHKGNAIYGIIALIGILFLHMATNLFDDIVDYEIAKKKIDKGIKTSFDFQKGKCALLFENIFTISEFKIVALLLFGVALTISIFFLFIYGITLFKIIIPTAILCLLYPILGCLGFGELIVALIFSPLLYLGVNYVMSGYFSSEMLLISISTGLLSVAVLHNHMLLDYNYDEMNRKITLCRLCKSKKNALYLLGVIILLSYINIVILTITKFLSPLYLLVFLSFPTAIVLYKVMNLHIKDTKEKIRYNIFMGNINDINNVPVEQKDFILKFLIMRNLLNSFTIWLCTAMVLECIL